MLRFVVCGPCGVDGWPYHSSGLTRPPPTCGEVCACTATPTSSPPRCSTPTGGGRPAGDAWNLFFHAPISLSLLGDAYAAHGMDRELDQLLGLYAGLAAGTVTDVQRQGGYVTGGHSGHGVPARLEITALVENAVPGEPTMRLHTHLYVGRTATALDTGARHPVDVDRLHRAANGAWRDYLAPVSGVVRSWIYFRWSVWAVIFSGRMT